VFAGVTMLGGASAAPASPHQTQDGLVNVAIGKLTIAEDVDLGVAAPLPQPSAG
jgi:hypothetical protein